jgi:hypothetical protein
VLPRSGKKTEKASQVQPAYQVKNKKAKSRAGHRTHISPSPSNPVHVIRIGKSRHVPAAGSTKIEPSYFLPELYSMTTDDKYKLICLVGGDKNAFPIAISGDADIDQLTQLIFQKGQLHPSIRLLDLTFWKVCNFLSY